MIRLILLALLILPNYIKGQTGPTGTYKNYINHQLTILPDSTFEYMEVNQNDTALALGRWNMSGTDIILSWERFNRNEVRTGFHENRIYDDYYLAGSNEDENVDARYFEVKPPDRLLVKKKRLYCYDFDGKVFKKKRTLIFKVGEVVRPYFTKIEN